MHAQQHNNTQSIGAPELARKLIEADQLYRRSNDRAVSANEREEARKQTRCLLDEILREDRSNAAALSLSGRIELDSGHIDKAKALFEASIDLEPDNANYLTNLGYGELAAGQPVDAAIAFQEALQLNRQSAAAFCGLAHAKRQQGHYDQAYLHYRKLLDYGLEWPSVYSGMLACTEHLAIHRADQELAQDAIRLLRNDNLPHQNLSRFVGTLLRHQYDLDNPNAEIFLEAASEDWLLILALERTLITDAAVEELVTLLRQAISLEVRETGSLRESLQPLALAIGVYADRTGFALLSSEEEAVFIRQLQDRIQDSVRQPWQPEDLAGALIIQAMYGALFHAPFATDLGQVELVEWPEGMQRLMAASYYNRALEEAHKQAFVEKEEELALAREDIPHAWPCWSNLQLFTSQRLQDELQQSLGIEAPQEGEKLRILFIGAQSGQRALEMAHYFTDVELIAVDEELANIAHASRRANELGLENVVFWPYSLASRFIRDGHQVQMVEIGHLPSTRQHDIAIDQFVNQALVPGGLLHINTGNADASSADRHMQMLIERHQLAPTLDNIRRLRRMVLNNRSDNQWQELLKSEDFYATAGCRSRWFFPEDQTQRSVMLSRLSSEVDWKLVKARDEDGHELDSGPVSGQLRAQHLGNGVRSLLGQGLSLYFQRRR
ncbi:hypothetical protein QQM79_13255 [Marinobacteraceae bacterium S3BR75-40.1]